MYGPRYSLPGSDVLYWNNVIIIVCYIEDYKTRVEYNKYIYTHTSTYKYTRGGYSGG